ncbi:CobQ/CobB/MinD/ParA nucleotide binding domain-containing protein [Cynara cardunculus var. scolymus]|uniref:CobQ/CobB/MinD/ParA nucleotide binding domain-containing protein n=1 Tax=Cynara cardunculus var. scolymus TaxID=59895 RepID=A0A124SE10_CYNCS|nr:CobQ/CobB/MinD/ParA nucleotide binding domain-containing protein [Cynara cardunculus var. scolymus]
MTRFFNTTVKKVGGFRGYAVSTEIGSGSNAQTLKIQGVKDIIAVASGKGGVGKSTTAVNLAVSLANKCQLNVGLLDADVYGPSIPMMMKLHGKPEVSKALEQMTRGVEWGQLDILVVDMPPGTGDAQISMSQRLQLSENMSYFKCPHCSKPSYIFGKGGARKTAEEMGLGFVGEIPLEEEIRIGSDEGIPVVISHPNSAVSEAFGDVAHKIISRLHELAGDQHFRPEITL